MGELKVGQRIDVFQFDWDNEDQIDHTIIKNGWQAVCDYSKPLPLIMGIDGKCHTCWADEIFKIGTLVITKLKPLLS